MKDIGLTNMILWIRICKIHDKLIFSKCHYIEKILDKFDKNENNIAKISIYANLLLYKNIGDAMTNIHVLLEVLYISLTTLDQT